MEKNSKTRRHSGRRDAIRQVIAAAAGPLTVAEIHARAVVLQPALGIATVYRAVNDLLAEGQLHPVILTDGATRYESAHIGHHHHFRCTSCQYVFDLPGCQLPNLDGQHLPGGFQVAGHEVTFFGLCPSCQHGAAAAKPHAHSHSHSHE